MKRAIRIGAGLLALVILVGICLIGCKPKGGADDKGTAFDPSAPPAGYGMKAGKAGPPANVPKGSGPARPGAP